MSVHCQCGAAVREGDAVCWSCGFAVSSGASPATGSTPILRSTVGRRAAPVDPAPAAAPAAPVPAPPVPAVGKAPAALPPRLPSPPAPAAAPPPAPTPVPPTPGPATGAPAPTADDTVLVDLVAVPPGTGVVAATGGAPPPPGAPGSVPRGPDALVGAERVPRAAITVVVVAVGLWLLTIFAPILRAGSEDVYRFGVQGPLDDAEWGVVLASAVPILLLIPTLIAARRGRQALFHVGAGASLFIGVLGFIENSLTLELLFAIEDVTGASVGLEWHVGGVAGLLLMTVQVGFGVYGAGAALASRHGTVPVVVAVLVGLAVGGLLVTTLVAQLGSTGLFGDSVTLNLFTTLYLGSLALCVIVALVGRSGAAMGYVGGYLLTGTVAVGAALLDGETAAGFSDLSGIGQAYALGFIVIFLVASIAAGIGDTVRVRVGAVIEEVRSPSAVVAVGVPLLGLVLTLGAYQLITTAS